MSEQGKDSQEPQDAAETAEVFNRYPGRPSKYTEERAEAIVNALRLGIARGPAARSNGISFDTFSNWLHNNSIFSAMVEQAEAECSVSHTINLRNAAFGYEVTEVTVIDGGKDGRITKTTTKTVRDPRLSLEWLKRRNREDWADNVEIGVNKLSDDELLQAILLGLGKAVPEHSPEDDIEEQPPAELYVNLPPMTLEEDR